jgi:protein TonB
MLDTLLESKAKRDRSASGTIASITAHTALVAAAIYATAQARVPPTTSGETIGHVYSSPRPRSPTANLKPTTTRMRPLVERSLVFVAPQIDIVVPSVDLTGIVSKPGDFNPGTSAASGSSGGEETRTGSADTPFRADQVERQVVVVPGSAPPRYPEALRSSGVEGQVIAEFVVDEHGRTEEGSIRFARSDNHLFEDAVRVALRRMRFVPAEVGGRKVKQLVQMPFVFTLSR